MFGQPWSDEFEKRKAAQAPETIADIPKFVPPPQPNLIQKVKAHMSLNPVVLQALDIVKADALKVFWPVISNYLTTLSNLPTSNKSALQLVEQIAAQSPSLIINLQAALPTTGIDVIADLAAMIEADAQNWVNAQAQQSLLSLPSNQPQSQPQS